jgi:ubiquinone/menaquinone biosynthesis C-methylase UbiE
LKLPPFIRSLYRTILPKFVVYNNIILPPKYLRYCGSNFHDNAHYLNSAMNESNRVISTLNADKNSNILDVGCGVGRLAIGLQQTLPTIKYYQGIDVSISAINWCLKYLKPEFPNFNFLRINMQNDLYNKNGANITTNRLPFADKTFDIIYLYSVFSHMRSYDIKFYLTEFNRIIKFDGKIFLTAFLEENVEDEVENPQNYRLHWNMPLHCIRFNKNFFQNLVNEKGFKIDRFEYEQETDGQTGIYMSPI